MESKSNRIWKGCVFLSFALLVGCPSSGGVDVKRGDDTGTGGVYKLRRQLRSTSARERKAAAVALGNMGEKAEKAIITLRKTLLDGHKDVSDAALNALAKIGARAVPALLYARSLSKPGMKEKADNAIKGLGPERVQALIQALKDPLTQVRVNACEMLGEMGAQAASAVPAITKGLKDEEIDVRVASANALSAIGPPHASTTNTVVALGVALKANKSWWRVRVAIAQALQRFGTRSAGVTAELIPLLSDRDANVYTAAIAALQSIGPAGLPAMKRAFPNIPWEGKVRIALVVAKFGSKAETIVPAIAKGLQDADSDVRKATIKALLRIGPAAKAAIPSLKIALADKQMAQDNWLGCLRVMLAIGKPGSDVLTQLINGSDEDLRKKIIEGFGDLGNKVTSQAVPVLVSGLKHKEKEVRWISAIVLRKLKKKAASALPALIAALSSKDPTTRRNVALALGAMGSAAKGALPALKKASADVNVNVKAAASKAIAQIKADTSDATSPRKAPTPPRSRPSDPNAPVPPRPIKR